MSLAYAFRRLWTISRVGGGVLTGERVANIQGANPHQINPWWQVGAIGVAITVLNGATFAAVKVYGAATQLSFPPPNTPAECLFDTGGVGAVNQGLWRPLHSRAGGFVTPASPLPPFLLLEYDMAAGGGGTSTLDVWIQLLGPGEISGHE